MLPPPVHEPQDVRDAADRILSDPRYDVPAQSLPDRILEWFGDQIGKILGSFVGSGAGTLFAWAMVAAAVGVVVFLVVRYGRVGPVVLPKAGSVDVMVELTRSPEAWRDEATRLEGAGRWREGLRCRHRALVAELVHRGVVADRAGRTAGEHVRDVAQRTPEAAPAMAAATELFEAAWYGGAPTGAAEAERFAALEAQVLVARGARA
jgi:hypothetical protein